MIRDQEGIPSDEISMSDLAFHALREYVPGDELRHVHWRSSAKASKLLIRQYHDTLRSHLTVVVDDDSGSYGDPEDFETAVSVAAWSLPGPTRTGWTCPCCAASTRSPAEVSTPSSTPAAASSSAPRTRPRACARRSGWLPETSWLVMLTGGQAQPGLAGVLRSMLGPGRPAAAGQRGPVGSDDGERRHQRAPDEFRTLDEPPQAILAAAPGALQ